MSLEALSFDFATLRAAYADGLDPVAVVDEVHARLEAAGDPGIFIALAGRGKARAAAAALGDPAGRPLWGIPFAVKDNIDVAGMPTTAGCPDYAYLAAETAPAVARLQEAGAILIGKTNLDQFATGLVGVRTPYPVPRNAFDPAIVPGGSSSGSAVSVARGIVSFALGTDTAGSGRVPAGLNNVVGLKPTLGAVSTRGVVPACRTLDCVSVFALAVADAYRVLEVCAGYDPADPYSRPVGIRPLGPVAPKLRIGIPDPAGLVFGGDRLSEAAFRASLGDVAGLGAENVEVDFSGFRKVAQLLYGGPWVAERYQAIRTFLDQNGESVIPVTRDIIQSARSMQAADVFAGFYRLAELRRAVEPIWSRIDMLAVPTYPRPRSVADLAADPIRPNSELGTYTNFVNLLDLAALAVPGRFRADGFPSGVTLIAPAGSDGLLAGFGERLHEAAGLTLGATGHALPEAPDRTPQAQAGETELAVVGAHLSGMALNHELTSRGARYLRTVATVPDYRLFALAGAPPARPGLLRGAPGSGHAIEAEVWAIPDAAVGGLVAAVPPPLAIGTVRLADGTAPKGFTMEAEGLAGAEDISRYGGWRAFAERSDA
ncbi:allophanate hydrolase [Propylenella binzhouense]|uniref:Allophanate hydrolase n=1 Tax=Propylenella binzhouense TaxID=2555902 RepID=A0A964WU80_9HYPH|nr:allophanate hydrolase [Propylenella binzhouense]MYZ48771.1 allophanate hydrolase [Propylenella binzhouense]